MYLFTLDRRHINVRLVERHFPRLEICRHIYSLTLYRRHINVRSVTRHLPWLAVKRHMY